MSAAYPLPKHVAEAERSCQACGKPVVWALFEQKVWRAVDAEVSPYGDVQMLFGGRAEILGAGVEVDDEEPLFLLHADVCQYSEV